MWRSTSRLLTEITSLRVKFPDERILLSKADVWDAFRKGLMVTRIVVLYVLEDIVVADLGQTSGSAGSPGFL